MRKIIEACPACGRNMEVTRLTCTACETKVTGRFIPTNFDRLFPEDLHFAELFIRLRGNIKDMERELGISYPTVRGRLDDVIHALGYEAEESGKKADEEPSAHRRDILDRLERGEIDATVAASLLKNANNS